MRRPLQGIKIIEFEGIGPAPVAGYYLAELGADITLIARPGQQEVIAKVAGGGSNPLERRKTRLPLDLKCNESDREHALDLVSNASLLLEGFRPGIMEKLGLGPDVCFARNSGLIYGRMTGWGQSGPLAQAAGHDLNYVALTGLLSLSARPGGLPIIPPTVLGDAVGGLGMAFGLMAALVEARTTGKGKIVDAAIVDIVASVGVLAQWLHGLGQLGTDRPSVSYDAPFYDVFECACGGMVSICAVEAEFFDVLLQKLGIEDFDKARQFDPSQWAGLKERFKSIFVSRSRAEWCEVLEGTDACFAPVLTMAEAPEHPHIRARQIFPESDEGIRIASVGPKFIAPS